MFYCYLFWIVINYETYYILLKLIISCFIYIIKNLHRFLLDNYLINILWHNKGHKDYHKHNKWFKNKNKNNNR